MKHTLLSLLLALAICLVPALAEDAPVTFAEDITGVYVYPENSTEADAQYVYRYCYPQLAGDSDLAMMFNTTYSYAAEDALGFEAPMQASDLQPGDPQKNVDVSYEITCLQEDYLSVKIIKRTVMGDDTTLVISGHVFPLTSSGAGKITNLPTLLGLLDVQETDEWLQTRQTNKADRVARELVWNKLQTGGYPLWEDLTFEEFEASFYPEEDFYLAENGDIVFFFQPGVIAPEEHGELQVPLTRWELEDEM